jgi:hypothetical protein
VVAGFASLGRTAGLLVLVGSRAGGGVVMSPDELAAWVAASCATQGLQVKVTDPATLRRVGVLLTGTALSGVASRSGKGEGVKGDGKQA